MRNEGSPARGASHSSETNAWQASLHVAQSHVEALAKTDWRSRIEICGDTIFMVNQSKNLDWSCSSVWLERPPVTRKVAGSSPVSSASLRPMGFVWLRR